MIGILNENLIDPKLPIINQNLLRNITIYFDPKPWLVLGFPKNIPEEQQKNIKKHQSTYSVPFNF